MDAEDRMFIRIVGSKMLKQLRSSNLRLYKAFMDRCSETGDKPESVLGHRALRFARSIVEEDGDYAEEVLGKTIKMGMLARNENLYEGLQELLNIRKMLADRDEIDELVTEFLKKEIKKSASSPLDALQQQPVQTSNIVIDENVLAQMDESSLDALEEMVRKVKEYKEASKYITSDDLEEVENELEGENRISDGDTESFEGDDEGAGLGYGGDEQDESYIEDDTEDNRDRERE